MRSALFTVAAVTLGTRVAALVADGHDAMEKRDEIVDLVPGREADKVPTFEQKDLKTFNEEEIGKTKNPNNEFWWDACHKIDTYVTIDNKNFTQPCLSQHRIDVKCKELPVTTKEELQQQKECFYGANSSFHADTIACSKCKTLNALAPDYHHPFWVGHFEDIRKNWYENNDTNISFQEYWIKNEHKIGAALSKDGLNDYRVPPGKIANFTWYYNMSGFAVPEKQGPGAYKKVAGPGTPLNATNKNVTEEKGLVKGLYSAWSLTIVPPVMVAFKEKIGAKTIGYTVQVDPKTNCSVYVGTAQMLVSSTSDSKGNNIQFNVSAVVNLKKVDSQAQFKEVAAKVPNAGDQPAIVDAVKNRVRKESGNEEVSQLEEPVVNTDKAAPKGAAHLAVNFVVVPAPASKQILAPSQPEQVWEMQGDDSNVFAGQPPAHSPAGSVQKPQGQPTVQQSKVQKPQGQPTVQQSKVQKPQGQPSSHTVPQGNGAKNPVCNAVIEKIFTSSEFRTWAKLTMKLLERFLLETEPKTES